jgi:hypothetical protein
MLWDYSRRSAADVEAKSTQPAIVPTHSSHPSVDTAAARIMRPAPALTDSSRLSVANVEARITPPALVRTVSSHPNAGAAGAKITRPVIVRMVSSRLNVGIVGAKTTPPATARNSAGRLQRRIELVRPETREASLLLIVLRLSGGSAEGEVGED